VLECDKVFDPEGINVVECARPFCSSAERRVRRISAALVVVIVLLASLPSTQGSEQTPRLRINYLAYPADWNGKTIMIGARFQLPLDMGTKVPAVILLHGTGGVRYTGVYYAAALNRAGIATLEIDQWGGRGLPGGASSRPRNLTDNLSDIAGAYRLLADRSEIDGDRIGLMGGSMGGIETLLMMTRQNSDAVLGPGRHLRAAAALYPACWLYNHVPGAQFSDLVDAPIRILVGSDDDYDGVGDACESLLHELAPGDAAHLSLRVFRGATHLFDNFEGDYEYDDPASHRRLGGHVRIHANPEARQQARDDLAQFFANALK
jgi:dienelactone hydrolase